MASTTPIDPDQVDQASTPTLSAFVMKSTGDHELAILMHSIALCCKAITRAVRKAGEQQHHERCSDRFYSWDDRGVCSRGRLLNVREVGYEMVPSLYWSIQHIQEQTLNGGGHALPPSSYLLKSASTVLSMNPFSWQLPFAFPEGCRSRRDPCRYPALVRYCGAIRIGGNG